MNKENVPFSVIRSLLKLMNERSSELIVKLKDSVAPALISFLSKALSLFTQGDTEA